MVIVSNSAPEALLQVVQRERISTFLSVPSVFQQLLTVPNPHDYDCSSLRVMAFAGSPMPVAAVRELRWRCTTSSASPKPSA